MFYSCNSSENSNYNPESELQSRSFKRRTRNQNSDSNSLDFVVESDNTAQSSELRTEIVKKKENSNNFICVYCDERFSNMRSFLSHIAAGMCMMNSTLFNGWKVCSCCTKLFCYVKNLRRHLKTSCKFSKILLLRVTDTVRTSLIQYISLLFNTQILEI